jgi:geranylgeranyl pyrophosphate synthase
MTIDTVQFVDAQANTATSEQQFNAALHDALQAVETTMFDVVNSEVTVLRDASRHILEAGGKRVRPRLLMLAYASVGGETMTDAARVAAAVELVHTASVVHDDINDHGVMRRGRPSINSIWGRTFALLTGDFLFTKVYELMAPYKDLNVILAAGTVALVEGETLQAQAVKENNFSREVYQRIIGLKTAALFRSAGLLGGELGGGTRAQIDAIGNYAYNVGLAFQIIDDVLDIVGDEKKLGKTSGIDIAQGRGYAAAYSNGENAPGENGDPMVKIKQKVLSGDTLGKAREQATMLVQMAIASLDVLPPSPARDGLVELAHSVIDRDF